MRGPHVHRRWASALPGFFLLMKREHVEELLDRGAGSDAEVAESLADLRRINGFLGGWRVLRRLLDEQVRRTGLRAFSLLDLATGSADLPARVRRRYPQARILASDFHLRHLRLARARIGRAGGLQLVCGDLRRPPFRERSFDFVSASLVLHHFTDEQLPEVLRAMAGLARCALLVNDLDRHWLPLYFIRWAWPFFARSPITRFDASASIRRAFAAGELERAARAAGFARFRTRWHAPFRRSLVVELD